MSVLEKLSLFNIFLECSICLICRICFDSGPVKSLVLTQLYEMVLFCRGSHEVVYVDVGHTVGPTLKLQCGNPDPHS